MPEKRTKEDTLDQLLTWARQYEHDTVTHRKEAQRDRDYYDGRQWTREEIAILERRGQPVITVNKIAPKVNYILGYEVRTRIDPKAYPRTPVHESEAHAVTDALRYVCDREGFDYLRSDVTENLLIEGMGGCVVEPEIVGEGDDAEVEIRLRYVPWERIFYDPRSSRPDFSDSKFAGIVTRWDFDDACADPVYGARKEILEQALTEAGSAGPFGDRPDSNVLEESDRRTVRIRECYWREDGEWWVAHYCRAGFLVDPQVVPLVDERGKSWCPLILVSAFVARGGDMDNMRYGVVRNMVSLQEEINKRRSKALHLLNMRQIVYEDGSVGEIMEAQAEAAKPDGAVRVNPGALRDGTFQINSTGELAAGQMQMLQEAKVEIDAVGPESPVIGGDKRAMSGRAIIARQQMGAMELEPVFDNLRAWQKAVFRAIWNMIRQFKTEEWWVRVTDDTERTGWRFVALNERTTRGKRLQEFMSRGMPFSSAVFSVGLEPIDVQSLVAQATQAAQQHAQQFAPALQAQGQQLTPQMIEQLALQAILQAPQMQEEIRLNDVSGLDVDIILDATPDTIVIQQEEFTELAEFAQSAPGMIPPQVLLQASSLRNKKELIAMMEKKPDPVRQQMVQLQLAQLQATIEKTKAEAADEQASAQERLASIGKVQAEAQNYQAQAMEHAAKAGEKAGGGMPMGGM